MASAGRLRAGIDRRAVLITAAVVALALAVGVAAYLMARSNGKDLASARAQGHRAGVSRGFASGTHRGYVRGFSASHSQPSRSAYERAYIAAYRRAFRDAGLAPPRTVSVPAP